MANAVNRKDNDMNSLTRWQRPELSTWPGFGRLTDLRDDIDRLFESPLAEWARSSNLLSGWNPALDLYDVKKYIYPRITALKSPVASMETSRGCFSQCIYCNKNIFGYKYRFKSPKRVVDEMKHILGLGFQEIHIVDDGFTTDINRAAAICEEILTRKLVFPWYVRGGIRVDRVSP